MRAADSPSANPRSVHVRLEFERIVRVAGAAEEEAEAGQFLEGAAGSPVNVTPAASARTVSGVRIRPSSAIMARS